MPSSLPGMRRVAAIPPSCFNLKRTCFAAFSSSSSDATAAGTYGRQAYELRDRLDREEAAQAKPIAAAGGVPLAPSTILSHAGIPPQTDGNEALSPPIELTTTFGRPPDGDYGPGGKIYARTDNATREALESVVGKMEVTPSRSASPRSADGSLDDHPPVCAAFSSGMAAVSAVLLAHPSPVRVVLPDDVYHGVPTQLTTVLGRHGVEWDRVDMTDLGSVREALEKAADGDGGSVVLWLETPSNPLCKVTDIRALCDLATKVRTSADAEEGSPIITTVVDSTWAPPPISTPLLLGADAVLHSGTKYLGGHSDVLLGIVTASPYTAVGRWLGPELKTVQISIGAVASPFDSWLSLRGLRTLHVRLERQCRSAMDLAEFLSDSSCPRGVERVHYPGLGDHPGHSVAREQMTGGMFGGMLSFEVQDDRTAMAVAGAVRTVRRGTSLGGTETLIEHRASIEPAGRITSPLGLLRVSVGLEDVDDLKGDLEIALSVAKQVVPG